MRGKVPGWTVLPFRQARSSGALIFSQYAASCGIGTIRREQGIKPGRIRFERLANVHEALRLFSRVPKRAPACGSRPSHQSQATLKPGLSWSSRQ